MRLAPSTKEKIDFFLRHPLTLSLTGMLLGSLLIPWHAYLGTNAVTHGSGAKEIMPSLNKQLRNLQQQRSEIAGNMAALFQ